MIKKPLQFYGVDFTDKLTSQPKEQQKATLRKLCYAFLCSNLPVPKIKKTLAKIEQKYSKKKLTKLLERVEQKQQAFQTEWEMLTKGKGFYAYQAKQAQIDRLRDWIKAFGKLSAPELLEFQAFLGLDKTEKVVLERDMKFWAYDSPARIKEYLDDYVVGQEPTKKMLSWAFYNNMLRTGRIKSKKGGIDIGKLPHSNLLLLGPSGSGKTYMIRRLAECFNIPFHTVDCAGLVCSGYVGTTLADVFARVINIAPNDYEAERSIVFFDEFDKMAENMGRKGSVGGMELQTEFLNIIQKGEIMARMSHHYKRAFRTDNVLFIFGGAFTGIDKIIEERQNKRVIGFTEKLPEEEVSLPEEVKAEDLVEYGLMPELVNRLSYVSRLHHLNKSEILEIMQKAKDSAISEFETYFKAHGQTFTIEEEVYDVIAEQVVASGKGARQINYLLHELFRKVLFDCPDAKKSKWTFTKADLN